MIEIDRVTFIQTVRWPKVGPTDALTSQMWTDIELRASTIMFTHGSGTCLIVPWSNIRWVSGAHSPTSTSQISPASTVEVPAKKRGRPRKT